MGILNILRKRWAQRKVFASLWHWQRANYSWVLYHARRWPLPGRGKVRMVRLAGVGEPFAVRLGTSDLPVVQEIFSESEYEGVAAAGLANVQTIVDLGTNIGVSLRYWLQHFPQARLIGVEPDGANLAMCRQNLELAGNTDRVTLMQACVGGSNRSASLDRKDGAWAIRMREPGEGEAGEVRVLDFASLLRECGDPAMIDLLKCDVEGAERELFAECGAWIGRVRNIVIELHWPYMQEAFLKDLAAAGAEFDVQPLHISEQLQVLFLRGRE